MRKKAFDLVMEGLTQVLDIAEGRADPSTYRIHVPAEANTAPEEPGAVERALTAA